MPSSATFVGKRLPVMRLMEAEFAKQYASAGDQFLKKIAHFVPYSFKDLSEVDLVEFSAMTAMKMLKYITGVQRLCVDPEDVFWYALWNTDADGDRLLIKSCSGTTCIIGWHEVSVAFGASHSESEEFRTITLNTKNFALYRPGEFLMETVETNTQRKLVNGNPYEEITYYKEAAPYGPTYFLMSVIAELFWCNGRSVRFTTPMVYAYMRSLHGHQTNRSKVILHNLKTEIFFLQKRALQPDNSKPIPICWSPVFIRILYAFRETIFAGTELAWADSLVAWVYTSKDGELDLRGILNKFQNPIDDLKAIRDRCMLSDNIPVAEPVNGPEDSNNAADASTRMPARKRPRDNQDVPVALLHAQDQDNLSLERTVRTRVTKRPKTRTSGPHQPTPTAGVRTQDPGLSAPMSSPTGGVRTQNPEPSAPRSSHTTGVRGQNPGPSAPRSSPTARVCTQDPGQPAPRSSPTAGVHGANPGPADPKAAMILAPNGGLHIDDGIFRELGTRLGAMLGPLVSKETEATFGHMIADSKAAASLKTQVVQLRSELQESKRAALDLNDQVAALKADLLLKAHKSDLLAAQQSASSI
ncbi:hypothetical protein R1sor_024428 [Riccia sorocarpa]|uniref:Fungal-type protein kinase domain-containing protein n=1 Tax=Riccia sorocarpa TaxID=122646 RepID=A0ABD3GTG6_9MARC